ncbi:hypothetical protein [Bradyrhizobium canariense]|uniref:hypothetical protein n=1 Tax=Bradyrhizobium canariense TaxID=255045 RepID=UPI0011BA57E0|nr:hypothetical protein [Bradyrhizobium canariense]
MPISFNLLLISIAIVPALVMFDGPVAQSLIEALAAIALAFVAGTARATDVNLAAHITRRLKLAAAVPVIWMVIQLLPMPLSGISHSIWVNADEALNQRSFGHISIDLGKTIEALTFYLANVALIVVGVFVVRDRRRAELTLFVLAAITALTTIALIINGWVPVGWLSAGKTNDVLAAVSSLGVILSVAAGTRAVERVETRRAEPARQKPNARAALLLAGAGLLICIAGLAISATFNVGLVAAFGIVTFISIQFIRRAGLAVWATGMFIATMVIGAAMIVLWRYNSGGTLSPFLQFATTASPDAISVAKRMLSDASWFGTGAGTYAQLLPIYQELGSSATKAPSTAVAFAIELGWPMTLFVFALSLGIIVTLYRGALNRGRDSFYPAAAAACAVIILGQAFCDASLLHSCIAVLGDAVIGLGLAQSVSRGDTS